MNWQHRLLMLYICHSSYVLNSLESCIQAGFSAHIAWQKTVGWSWNLLYQFNNNIGTMLCQHCPTKCVLLGCAYSMIFWITMLQWFSESLHFKMCNLPSFWCSLIPLPHFTIHCFLSCNHFEYLCSHFPHANCADYLAWKSVIPKYKVELHFNPISWKEIHYVNTLFQPFLVFNFVQYMFIFYLVQEAWSILIQLSVHVTWKISNNIK